MTTRKGKYTYEELRAAARTAKTPEELLPYAEDYIPPEDMAKARKLTNRELLEGSLQVALRHAGVFRRLLGEALDRCRSCKRQGNQTALCPGCHQAAHALHEMVNEVLSLELLNSVALSPGGLARDERDAVRAAREGKLQ